MNKTKLMFALLASLALGACSSDDDELTSQLNQEPSFPLTIEVTENPMTIDGKDGSGAKRAAIATNSSITGFTMNYVYGTTPSTGSATATKDSEGKWSSSDGWPYDAASNDYMVTWYASTYNNFQYNSGTPYINFEVEEAAASQHDLLVATASGTYSGTGGNLSFTFDHPCSAVRFWVKKSTNIIDKTLTVSSIVLKNVIKTGKYYYGTASWTLGATSTDYTLLSSAQTLASDSYVLLNGSENDSYLFLIPQTLTAWNPTGELNNTYLELTCSINGGGSQTAYIPFAATFAKGTKYDVKINIGKNSLYSSPNTKVIP